MATKIKIEINAEDNTSSVLDKIERKAGGASRSTSGLGAAFGAAGGAAARFAKTGAVAAIASVGVASVVAVKKFMDYQTALIDMGKVTDQSFGEIDKSIKELDSSLGDSTELVGAYYQAISAGAHKGKEALDLVADASRLAKVAHVEQGETIKALTKLRAGYEGEIRSYTEAADLLMQIEQEGQTSVAELVPVIGEAAKISHDAALSYGEMGGSLALISQTAGSTSQAVTQLKAIMVAMLTPNKDMEDAVGAYGVTTGKALIEQYGFIEALKMIKAEADASGMTMNKLLGSVEAGIGFSALAANNFETLGQKIGAMDDKTGKLDASWKDYMEGTEAALDSTKNVVNNLLIEWGERLAPGVVEALGIVRGTLTEHKDDIATIMDGVISFASSWITGAGIIIGAIANLDYSWSGFKNKFVEGLSSIRTTFMDMVNNLVASAFSAGTGLINSMISGIKSRVSSLFATVSDMAASVMDLLPWQSPARTGPLSALDRVGPSFINTITGGIQRNRNRLTDEVNRIAGAAMSWTRNMGMAGQVITSMPGGRSRSLRPAPGPAAGGGGYSYTPSSYGGGGGGGSVFSPTIHLHGLVGSDMKAAAVKLDRELAGLWSSKRSELRVVMGD